jgi:hypothetical protein
MENPASQQFKLTDNILENLHAELSGLIAEARTRAAKTVNSELTQLYWHIGKRLREQVLQGQRASYGWRILEELGVRLSSEFGRGFEEKNLRRMIQFVECYPEFKIVASLMRQLTWTHFLLLIPLKKHEKREYTQ